MADVILVAIELKEQCKLRCLRIVALNQNALAVELFTEDIGCEIGGDESNFEVTLIACVVVDNVVMILSIILDTILKKLKAEPE